jgi:hypothetical protein
MTKTIASLSVRLGYMIAWESFAGQSKKAAR